MSAAIEIWLRAKVIALPFPTLQLLIEDIKQNCHMQFYGKRLVLRESLCAKTM